MSRRKTTKDPHAKREAEKYENPIVSREFILSYLSDLGNPASFSQLLKGLKIKKDEAKKAFRRRLRAMERDGQIIKTRRGAYCVIDKSELIQGRVQAHRDGYGFVIPDEGGDDLYLGARQMRAVFHGDTVLVREAHVDRRGRREAILVEVITHNTHEVVGRLVNEEGKYFLMPDNKRITHDIVIPEDEISNAEVGEIVQIEITEQPRLHNPPVGKVIKVLGEHLAPGMEVNIALQVHGVPHQWPKNVLKEISQLSVDISDKDKRGREDLRELPFVTIDGNDAKDFDDAVFCEPVGRGAWNLYVAIADVSHYVKQGSALDEEAIRRGNSVYFPNRVVPMLPEILSNGLCSLKPKVDRLVMVCEMRISSAGSLVKFHFYPAVIHSHARLTYEKVTSMLEDTESGLRRRYAKVLPHLEDLHSLYEILHEKRVSRGAIDFDLADTKIIFGSNQKIKSILPTERSVSHRMIEESMLLANVATARFLSKDKIPALYRVHEPPEETKLTDLKSFLKELGIRAPAKRKWEPVDFSKVLVSAAKRADMHLIQTVMLCTMRQAQYQQNNCGHFGLAFKAYTHFTSPIRRYPDLIVHRAIRYALGNKKRKNLVHTEDELQELGKHCSQTERRADEATRDVVNFLKCEYMQDRVGEKLPGIISGVTSFGLFIELQNIYVEGLLHITELKSDYYRFDSVSHTLTGEHSGKVYRLGDKIRIQVARVDLDEKNIDFILAK